MSLDAATSPEEEEDYAHPERRLKNLVFAPDGLEPPEAAAQRGIDKIRDWPHHYGGTKGDQLCWACGWTSDNQCYSSYEPRIKILHTRDSIGLWKIGSQWLIRDQPNGPSLGNDYMTNQFLRQHLGSAVPIVEMQRLSQPTDPVHYTLMSRAPGDTLRSVWDTLTSDEKSSYSKQLAGYMKQWRRFTAPSPMKVDGSLLYDTVVAHCFRRRPPTCKKIGPTKEAWLESITDELREGLRRPLDRKEGEPRPDKATVEARLQEIKRNFPSGEPYTLTHGDLHCDNIMVKDGKITAIIDWEFAGFHPWWSERWSANVGGERTSAEFLELVWAEMYSESEMATLMKAINSVVPVRMAYDRCSKHHSESDTAWLRPGFCDCKRYGGEFRLRDLGYPIGHEIVQPRPAADTLAEIKARSKEVKRAKMELLSKAMTNVAVNETT